MTKIVKAKICWVPGARKSPPTGPRYSTVARFKEDQSDWLRQAWSLVLEFRSPPDESLCLIADVRFLVEDAPVHFLHPGSAFELFEGRKVVATGEVVSDSLSHE